MFLCGYIYPCSKLLLEGFSLIFKGIYARDFICLMVGKGNLSKGCQGYLNTMYIFIKIPTLFSKLYHLLLRYTPERE